MKTKLTLSLLFVFFISHLIDIGGLFYIKHISILLILLGTIGIFIKFGILRDFYLEASIILFFILSTFYANLRGIKLPFIYQAVSFVGYFSLLGVLWKTPKGKPTDIFNKTILLGSLITIATFVAILLFPEANIWRLLSSRYRLGFLGIQNFGTFYFPNVYYRWMMWFIPAVMLTFGRDKQAVWLLMISVFLQSSLSVILFSLLGILFLIFLFRMNKWYIFVCLFLVMGIILGIFTRVFFPEYWFLLIEGVENYLLFMVNQSISIKLGHIQGVLSSTSESMLNLLFGMGAGSQFYSPGIKGYTRLIEVSHFDFLRQFGLIGWGIFFGYVLFVFFESMKTDELGKRWAVGLLFLFISAGTNPLLMSPVFMIVLMLVRNYSIQYRKTLIYE